MRFDCRYPITAMLFLLGTVHPCLWGQMVFPDTPSREYIRLHGRVISELPLPTPPPARRVAERAISLSVPPPPTSSVEAVLTCNGQAFRERVALP